MDCLKHALVVLGLSCTASLAYAATEFSGNIPPELLGYFSADLPIYSDLVDDFTAFTLPDGITIMGSQDSGADQSVLMRTLLGGAEFLDALVAEFTSRGWLELPLGNNWDWGFIIFARPGQLIPVTICNDDYGYL